MLLLFAPIKIGSANNNKIRQVLGVVLLLSITIFRFDVGFDYKSYYYNLYPYFDIDSYERLEPIGKIFMNISHISGNPQIFFILYGIITILCFYYSFTKYSHNVFLSIFVYLAFFYLPGLSTIRQEAAVSIILLGYQYINKKKPLLYITFCIIASLFHTSALITTIFYPFLRIKNKWKLAVITAASILLLSITINIATQMPLFAAYYHYIDSSDEFKGGAIIRFLYLSISVILTYLGWKKHNIEVIKLSLLSIMGCVLMFILGGHIGGRISEYFTIFLCIAIPNVCTGSLKKYKLSIGIALSLIFLTNIYISKSNPNKQPYTPYQTIFQIDKKNPKFK